MILRTESLTKSFGGIVAVNAVDLDIQNGDIHAVIGPNGAGKTTFFNLLTKYLDPDEGRVIFKGNDITELAPHQICKMGISRSFQIANIFPMLTVAESIQMAVLSQKGKVLNMFRPVNTFFRSEVADILDSVGLNEHAHVRGDSLSHGDKKRLDLAIALSNRPELLLLDEPTAGMSGEETRAIMELVSKLHDKMNLTILFTEHDMPVVFNFAKRITVLHQGCIITDGTPEEVRTDNVAQRIYLGEQT